MANLVAPLSFDTIKDTLVSNTCALTFIDDEENTQTVTCTLNPDSIPESAGKPFEPRSEENPVYIKPYNLYVWDLDNSKWQKINMTLVIEIATTE